MTDTAQPLPSETDDLKTADGALTPAQLQRAAALDIARAALLSRTGLFASQQVGPKFDVIDLMSLADWVLGVDAGTTLALPEAANYDGPDNRAEGTEISPGLEYVTTFRPDPPKSSRAPDTYADDKPTEALPAYPEDALPR